MTNQNLITVLMSAILGLFAAWLQGCGENEAQAQAERCKLVNAQVIQEFDEILAKGKFPTDKQQENWKAMTAGCEEKS